MYWYSDERSIQFNFNGQKGGLNKDFYGHRSIYFYGLRHRTLTERQVALLGSLGLYKLVCPLTSAKIPLAEQSQMYELLRNARR